jgi:hypothetical protein
MKALVDDEFLMLMFTWCAGSRRVLSPSPDLRLELLHTGLDGVDLSEISFPFDSFAVALDEPLVDREGKSYDLIQFGRVHSKKLENSFFDFQVFSTKLQDYQPISRKHWRQLETRQLNRRNRESLRQELNSLWYHRIRPMGDTVAYMEARIGADGRLIYRDGGFASATVGNIADLADVTEAKGFDVVADVMKAAVRLTLGLCLYLESCGTSRPSGSRREPIPAPGTRSISDGAEVFDITYIHTLTPEEREILRGLPIDDRTATTGHYRRGYWSRPPGKGDDPMARKTVWHRPTIVRRDLLTAGTLPLGSTSKVG